MRPVVIIDGNNLAHRKYQLPNGNVPIPIMNRLISELSTWAESEQCFVELCFDPCTLDPEKNEHLKVFVARTRTKADDEVEERALYHAYRRESCLVVTEDGELQDKAVDACARYVRCDDFASGHGAYGFMLLPSMPDPPPLVSDNDGVKSIEVRQKKSDKKNKKIRDRSSELQELQEKTLANRSRSSAPSITSIQEMVVEPVTEINLKLEMTTTLLANPVLEGKYTLNICNWPIQQGIRFIIESACRTHRQELEAIIAGTSNPTPDDLISLFTFFVDLCRDEPDLISRGGSLMDRVKLSLIKNHPEPLTFAQIEVMVGGNTSAMRKKIEKSIPVWVAENKHDSDADLHLENQSIIALKSVS